MLSETGSSRTALFIDGANLHATARAPGFDMDFRLLLAEFSSRGTLVRAFYYTTTIEDLEYSSIRPLLDWLDYNGYTVVTKPAKDFVDAAGRRKSRGSMDVDLAVDAMEFAPRIDQIVLFSGDGDFRPLVAAVQRRGVHVRVVSTISSQPPLAADELRRQADVFLDIVELQARIGRDPAQRPLREPARTRASRRQSLTFKRTSSRRDWTALLPPARAAPRVCPAGRGYRSHCGLRSPTDATSIPPPPSRSPG
jgi:uncharacterized LabA/DUF88 family protein